MAKYQDIQKKVELALIYFEDGAGHTAARLLREAADDVEGNAQLADAFIKHLADREQVKKGRL